MLNTCKVSEFEETILSYHCDPEQMILPLIISSTDSGHSHTSGEAGHRIVRHRVAGPSLQFKMTGNNNNRTKLDKDSTNMYIHGNPLSDVFIS